MLPAAAGMLSDWGKGGEGVSYLDYLEEENSRTRTLNGAAAYSATGSA